MPGYGQMQRAPAEQKSADVGREPAREHVGAADALGAALNESPRSQSLMQLRATLDGSPRVQALRGLGRALNRTHELEEAEPEEPQQEAIAQFAVAPANVGTPDDPPPVQKKPNATGLPDRLKAGVEQLSGLALDDVRVHYNSSKPAAVQAHAYAQGTDIHVAPGQEKHLPHEAWHVVQQKQGRVKPTLQMKGVAINDDSGLEIEATALGQRAASTTKHPTHQPLQRRTAPSSSGRAIIQLAGIAFATVVGKKVIKSIAIDRDDEKKNFDTGAGDHSTAHVVFRHWAQNVLVNKPVSEVGGCFDGMMTTAQSMPGYTRKNDLDGEKQMALAVLESDAEDKIREWKQFNLGSASDDQIEKKIIATATAIINFRNNLPLSAMEFGGPGSGEGGPAGYLNSLNAALASGSKTSLTGAEIKSVEKAIGGLFDIQRFTDATTNEPNISEVGQILDQDLFPGYVRGDEESVLIQHVETIRAAYPALAGKLPDSAFETFKKNAWAGQTKKDENQLYTTN